MKWVRRPVRSLSATIVPFLCIIGCGSDDASDERARALSSLEWAEKGPTISDACQGPRDGIAGTFSGDTILVRNTGDPPCDMRAVSAITLEHSPDGTRPDPGSPGIVRMHDGSILTAARGRTDLGVIIQWTPRGDYVRSFGRFGDGPGEFSSEMALELYRGPGDSIHVNDKRRITVLDPSLRYVRQIEAPRIGWEGKALIVTESGAYVYGGQGERTKRGYWFHVYSSDGAELRSFGTMSGPMASAGHMPARTLAYGGGRSFWAAPPDESPTGYLLEEWTTDGELLRVLKREADWLGAADPTDRLSLPAYRIQLDEGGLLWVIVLLKSPKAPQLAPGQRPPGGYFEDAVEMRIDVIDPTSATLLASAVLEDNLGCMEPLCLIPARFLPHSGEAVNYLEGDGILTTRLFSWHLVRPRR
jgi:hypothetical protein